MYISIHLFKFLSTQPVSTYKRVKTDLRHELMPLILANSMDNFRLCPF